MSQLIPTTDPPSLPAPGGGAIPADLPPEASLHRALLAELNPVGAVASLIVEEIARRAHQIREYDTAMSVLRREGEAALYDVLAAANTTSPAAALELARASVLAGERHQALLRQSVTAARGFYQGIHSYQAYLASQVQPTQLFALDPRYCTDPACAAHLVRRFAHGRNVCGRCESAGNGTFVPSRLCWQCSACHAQTGIRAGSCFERSAIALSKWFAAIRVVLMAPTTSAADLARFLQISRTQTVSRMRTKIRAAMVSADATVKLAGLDQIYLGSG
jgi:hypothetical protein